MRPETRFLRFALAAALAVAPAKALAQITTAAGTVTDSVTGQPLGGVLVSLSGNGYLQRASSRDDGSFRFTRVTPGTYTLSARRLGFAPLDMPIPIEENGVRLNVSLVRIATALDTVRAKTGTGIAGEVGTLQSLRRLANAAITVIGVGTRIRSDSAGRFFVPIKNPGTYVVRARVDGYEAVAVSVVVPRDSTAKLMMLMDTARSERSNMRELAWQEFNDRARLRGQMSAIISQAELQQTGEVGLLEALQRVPALTSKQMRFGPMVCVFVDGRPAAGAPIRGWDVEEVEAVEVYTVDRRSEATETIARASRGYECQPTEVFDSVVTPRDRIRWLVIWTKR
jgi:hypothetical protein